VLLVFLREGVLATGKEEVCDTVFDHITIEYKYHFDEH
jgi:hypothetical protein